MATNINNCSIKGLYVTRILFKDKGIIERFHDYLFVAELSNGICVNLSEIEGDNQDPLELLEIIPAKIDSSFKVYTLDENEISLLKSPIRCIDYNENDLFFTGILLENGVSIRMAVNEWNTNLQIWKSLEECLGLHLEVKHKVIWDKED